MSVLEAVPLSATKSKSGFDKQAVLNDYKIAYISRETSYLGRKEVLTGKAKFGIFGDGKELAQLAMAKVFENGDFRSGYYRDQTFMMAIGHLTVQQFFAQLYAHANVEADPSSAGRQMNCHFATRSLDENGKWKAIKDMKNSSPDISPTAGQMVRLLGLAQASKVYRYNEAIPADNPFSRKGNEVAFGTIGDASTSEGHFWETINAAGVLQVPMVLSVWDDGYGISVAKKFQTTKESISDLLRGFKRTKKQEGIELLTVKAWDYEALLSTYEEAARIARYEHVPVVIHVEEVTQPQGHSTSGSHERYKSKERLEWETEFCCNRKFREWILKSKIATEKELDALEEDARNLVLDGKKDAWSSFLNEIKTELNQVSELLTALKSGSAKAEQIEKLRKEMHSLMNPLRRDVVSAARKALHLTKTEPSEVREQLISWVKQSEEANWGRYNSHLLSESDDSPMRIAEIRPEYGDTPPKVDGRVVLRDNFATLFERHPEMMVFGEDAGKLGDVNLGLEGMQERFGELRVSDTGIREATILGQGIGLALRGLRPIAEIQYLDYLLYCLQGMSDDLSTVRYRTKGGQKAPVIVRTRGHRLEGIWHSGSPMGMILNSVRGMHVCVPRNLTTAAGFYNTLIQGDDPALIIEPLNAYRQKELLPVNLGDFTTPLGIPELVREGSDITVVSYGSTFNIVAQVAEDLAQHGISVELIDVRTLLPFDIHHSIVESLKKTNRIIFIDEDVPGGATAFMMQQVLDIQGGYQYLDAPPKALAAAENRPAYGSDGDYFCKPSAEDIFEAIYSMMHECKPTVYQALW